MQTEEHIIQLCPCRCDKLRVSQIIKILNLYTPAGCTRGPLKILTRFLNSSFQMSLRRGSVRLLSEKFRVAFR